MENSGCGTPIMRIKMRVEENGEILYILLQDVFEIEEGNFSKGYSIRIESNIEGEFESELLENVSSDYEEAFDLLVLFARNTVTPDSALYVMEDLLS